MITREHLLNRLADIGEALQHNGNAVALLGAGSTGLETERLDEHSDLDFLAVVAEGYKDEFITSLAWLESVHPIAYAFKNTKDGYKILFEDGIFAEFGILEPQELKGIPFPPARIIWKSDSFDERLADGSMLPIQDELHSPTWMVGEILTNLYVGLHRYHRGEKLSALMFIQVYAVSRIMELAPYIEPEQNSQRDIFAPERRFEARFPSLSARLPTFAQGYSRTPESARAILEFMEEHFEVNSRLRSEILALID